MLGLAVCGDPLGVGSLLQSQQLADGMLTANWCKFRLDRQRLKCSLTPPCLAACLHCLGRTCTALVKDACEAVALLRLSKLLPPLTKMGDHHQHSAVVSGPRAC